MKKGDLDMKKIKKGDRLQIQCYKHDGKRPHKSWDEAILIDMKDDYLVFGNDHTLVTKEKGGAWRTKEPAVIYFFKDKWFNIIAQIKKDSIAYYCNIASPIIIEDGTIKYIDYDLDLRIFPSGSFKILDRNEYKYHKKKMNYSAELDKIIQYSLSELITSYKKNDVMFDKEKNMKYVCEYQKLKDNDL